MNKFINISKVLEYSLLEKKEMTIYTLCSTILCSTGCPQAAEVLAVLEAVIAGLCRPPRLAVL